ncbi:hypothetical protein MN608_08719 [Microdochium nivale]|nr:hypothetical protein MN608_08719 [Microdochium nivale]
MQGCLRIIVLGEREELVASDQDHCQKRQIEDEWQYIGGTSEGTIFEDCIASGPKDITPSGRTHSCDGTNNGANPSPGGTLTTQIDAAGLRDGFGFDGTYRTHSPGEGLWAFDAFATNRIFLKLDPEYQVLAAGTTTSVTLTVRQANPNSGALSPASGAAVGGQTSDASGNV